MNFSTCAFQVGVSSGWKASYGLGKYRCSATLPGGRFRSGQLRDYGRVAQLVIKEGMNPLLGDMNKFVVHENELGELLGCGQVRSGNPGEVSSVVVSSEMRGQGLGTRIVGELVRLHGNRELCLITIGCHSSFYEKHGFRECSEDKLLPGMRTEMKIGRLVAGLWRPEEKVIAMYRESDKGEKR